MVHDRWQVIGIERTMFSRHAIPVLCTISFLWMACAAPDASSISPADPKGAREARRIYQQHTRSAHATQDIAIHATRWDNELVSAEKLDLPKVNYESPEQLEKRLERWREDFVATTTTVTVLLEIRNRPGDSQPGKDPLLTPEQWTFFHQEGGKPERAPVKLTVLGTERFPTRAGGGHWRIAVNLHFPKVSSNGNLRERLIVVLPEEAKAAGMAQIPWTPRPIKIALPTPG
jgi:hypothetical protein